MSDQRKGGIAWTDQTWNPTRGCSRVSEGCRNCYAETVAARFSGPGLAYEGLAHYIGGEARWTGKLALAPARLADPLRWQRPRRIFVNSMSDVFHESLPFKVIDQIFAVMALAPQHTFQILTKRADRMREYCSQMYLPGALNDARISKLHENGYADVYSKPIESWPLPNVWLGVSVEDQVTADWRIPLLLKTPAALRFVSYEPALGAVDFRQTCESCSGLGRMYGPDWKPETSWLCSLCAGTGRQDRIQGLDWVIIGGESGHNARAFSVQWARDAIAQCNAAGVACFMKQLGSRPIVPSGRLRHWEWGAEIGRHDPKFEPTHPMNPSTGPWRVVLDDNKGGDPEEWPQDLRVREFPEVNSGN